MSENNSNSNENQNFELISKESIKLFAEQNGFQNVSEDAILLLSSDVSFRLREVIHNSLQFMRHSKRKRLTSNDLNRSLEWSDCQLVFGYESSDSPINDLHIKESNVFVTDDPIVDLVEETNKILNESVCDIKLFEKSIRLSIDWLSVEGRLESKEEHLVESSLTVNSKECSQELIDYYQYVVKAILGNDNQLLYFALKDLSSNSRISPVLPFFINFISNGIKKLSHDILQLKRLLNTIESLFKNCSLFLATDPYLNVLIQSVLYCIQEPLNPISDHWTLRDSASHLLINILHEWCTPFGGNQLRTQTINSLLNTLLDFSKPFSSHYGVIKAFLAFGYDIIIEHLYPCFNQYCTHLLSAINQNEYLINTQTRTDALRVFGELLLVSEVILLKLRSLAFDDLDFEKYCNIYGELSHIFGDALSGRLPSDFERIRHRYYAERTKNICKSNVNLFTTPESLQTGEELLDAFYEVPAHTDEINSNMSANLEDENSCDETSVMSDNEKETVATDVDLQIQSTISDPTLGIKLTIKKLRRDQNESGIATKKSRIDKKIITEPVFDYTPLLKNRIRFNVTGVTNKVIIYEKIHKIDFHPSKWFIMNKKNQIQKKYFSKSKPKSKSNFNLYSCDLLNIL